MAELNCQHCQNGMANKIRLAYWRFPCWPGKALVKAEREVDSRRWPNGGKYYPVAPGRAAVHGWQRQGPPEMGKARTMTCADETAAGTAGWVAGSLAKLRVRPAGRRHLQYLKVWRGRHRGTCSSASLMIF
jgi:hypothetical protein